MPEHQLLLLTAGVLLVAFLYSSVGHAGASGYIAVMSLAGLSPALIKPTALVLNILVASLGVWHFLRAGHFSWKIFWPFALLAAPAAFLGGFLKLPDHAFKVLVGSVLLFSAVRFFLHPKEHTLQTPPTLPVSLLTGAGLGFLAGLTGTGGGIFLTPLLLFMRWATTKQAAGISALFILLNSASGLLGNFASTSRIPNFALFLAVAAVAGGALGSYLGSNRFPPVTIKRLLALVLFIAGAKLILGA